jgi:hypothetical protein
MAVWSSGFFLAERPFRLRRYRTRFTVDIDTFVSVSSSILTRSFAVFLGLICTFRTKLPSSLGDRTRLLPERYGGCVVPWCLYLHLHLHLSHLADALIQSVLLFVQMNMVPSGFWKLLPRMNQTCGVLQFFSEVLPDFL